MPRKIGARAKSPNVNTSLISLFSKDCMKEWQRQYHYLKTHPDCARIPPPRPNKIKKEVEKLRDMIHPTKPEKNLKKSWDIHHRNETKKDNL
mgnify:CR=1 FL=1